MKLPRLSVKFKLFLPIFIGIIFAVSILTLLSIQKAQKEIHATIEKNLQLEVQTIVKMFERERTLKFNKVDNDLKVAHELFYDQKLHILDRQIEIEIENQITHETNIKKLDIWKLGDQQVHGRFEFVDLCYELFEGTTTIFQKSDSGYVRISTNVLDDQGKRAVGTYIPNNSPVVQTIEKGETFYGRAYVVNDWYITAYEPIYNNGVLVGMLYVGDKEKDLEQLRAILNSLKIGKSGYAFAIDEHAELIMHPHLQGGNLDQQLLDQIIDRDYGLFQFRAENDKQTRTIAFEYFPDFRLYVCASIDLKAESSDLITGIIWNAIVIAVITIIVFAMFLYFITNRNVHTFLSQIEQSSKQLAKTREELQKSEEQFKTLFNNSSDEIFVGDYDGFILEVNDVACESLGYSREELMGLHFRELKSERFLGDVQKNLDMIKHFGQYRYETENIAKDGRIIPVEMKSRVIDYKGEKRILSIARDITERKEIEERILKAIISTEEAERKRFAADLHDDLAPILTTIKLYTDLLKKDESIREKKGETIDNIDELTDMAIRTSKEISNNIRPNVLQDFGLAAAINEFCSFINDTKSLKIKVQTQNYKIDERSITESILFQAVKELVNNTLKHSEAENVTIDLKSYENQIILYYRDDGKGFDVPTAMKNKSGLGIYNIVNKVKTINGVVDLNSEEGRGMFMVISIKVLND